MITGTNIRHPHSRLATILVLVAAVACAQQPSPLDLRLHPQPDRIPRSGPGATTPDERAVDTSTSVHGGFSTEIGYSKPYGNSTVNTAELDVNKQYDNGRSLDLHIEVLHSTGLPSASPHDYVSRYPGY